MEKSVETIRGDSEGIAYEFALYRISGTSSEAPSAYIQAALHGDELPGVVAIDALMPKLRKAENEFEKLKKELEADTDEEETTGGGLPF